MSSQLVAAWNTTHRHIGRQVEVYDRLESTNALALERSRDPASDGLALLAQQQLAGRGQYGRSWLAPAGSSVLLSVVVFPPPHLRRPALLTAWAAASVCELIDRVLAKPQAVIKWPNDVLLCGKKVCGILIEQHGNGTVAGIGLNVRQEAAHFIQAQLPLAGSLLSLTGQLHDSLDVAKRLLDQLDEQYAALAAGRTADLEAIWRRRLGLEDRHVRLELGGSQREGKLREIAFAGLVLELPSGEMQQFQPEAIRGIAVMNDS